MALETSNRPMRKAGLYKHPESGAEVIVRNHPKFGDAQAAAAEQVGYRWEREVTQDEVDEMNKPKPEPKTDKK